MDLLRLLWKWFLRCAWFLWLVLLVVVVLKFYKDNPGTIELTFYTLEVAVPAFILGVIPLLLVAAVLALIAWVWVLRLRLVQVNRRYERARSSLQAVSGSDG